MTLVHRERLAERSRALGVDIVLASVPENVRYLVDLPDDLTSALGLPMAVAARTDPFEVTALVAPRGMAGWIPETLVPDGGIRLYGRFNALRSPDADLGPGERFAARLLESAPGEGDAFEAVLGELIAALPSTARLAWDDPAIGAIAIERGRHPAADGSRLVRDVRQVKTAVELDRLQRAAEIAEEVEREIFDATIVGADWADVARSVPAAVANRGGRFGFLTGGVGWQSGFVFAPRPMSIEAGQLVRLDLGLSVDGYWTDTGRSASIGTPSAEATARYAAVRSGADAALGCIRPGVTFEAIYDVAMAAIRSTIPEYRRHHCGHAIGLRAYDGPLVAAGDTTVLEQGMVLNVEVPLYDIGWGGLQLEDTVVVESDGFRSLTRLDRDLIVLPA